MPMNGNEMGKKGFLGLNECFSFDTARIIIIPFGFEGTVTYGKGTAKGPAAIIAASHEVELYDEDLLCEPYKAGICTIKEPAMGKSYSASMKWLEKNVSSVIDAGKFPIVLGGEHSITPAAVKAASKKHKDLIILHFDAHSDLREEFEGKSYSHACAMHSCLPFVSRIISVGIRNVSAEELPVIEANKEKISIFYGRKDLAKRGIESVIQDVKKLVAGKNVYLTFDIDVLDPSVIGSSTGTPEPGGICYNDVIDFFEALIPQCNVVGADFVELAPIKGQHSPDFAIAKIIQKFIAYRFMKDITKKE